MCSSDGDCFGDTLPVAARRNMVRLRVRCEDADVAKRHLELPDLGHCAWNQDILALGEGPNQWLLASDALRAADVIAKCGSALPNTLHLAIDMSAGLRCLQFRHAHSRGILAAGCGVDLRELAFPSGRCARTRLAGLAVSIFAAEISAFDIYVTRSHEKYLRDWITYTHRDPILNSTGERP
jgi:sarcosine oxidase, subunit gamma